MEISSQLSQKNWRILAVEHGKISRAIIKELKEVYNKRPNQLIHVGRRKADIDISCMLYMSNSKSGSGHILDDDKFTGAASELTSSDRFNEYLLTGMDSLQRRTEGFKYNTTHINGFHDSQHYYHIAIDVLARLLSKNKINLVLFFDIPHLFNGMLLYQIAQSRGIRTLVLAQSIFHNSFFSLRHIDDCGLLPVVPLAKHQSLDSNEIDPNDTPDLYYMNNIYQERGELGRLTKRGVLQFLTYLLSNNPLKLLRPIYMIRQLILMHRISSEFPSWRDPFATFFHPRQFQYLETLLDFEDNEIDMDKKFVYFPLQFQPEMTTVSLGGKFSDQILAIERLAELLPNDYLIYVKENPRQTSMMRGAMFFNRLKRIPNLRILPSYASTFALTENAEFIATVTGTVGWEAICRGKIALIFGRPWYRSLPGVIEYYDGIKFEKIRDVTFEHAQLELHAGWLKSRLHSGLINRVATRSAESFNWNSNIELVKNSVCDLIEERLDTTFK